MSALARHGDPPGLANAIARLALAQPIAGDEGAAYEQTKHWIVSQNNWQAIELASAGVAP
jgi:hypothetical protein